MTFILAAAADAETAGGLSGIFTKFGVTWPFFIAQLINFVLVLFVLKKFAIGPIQGLLDKRRQRIEDGEAKLVEIEEKLAQSEKEKAALLEAANADAKRLITEAKDSAATLTEQKTQEAVAQAQNIITKAEEAARAERATMAAELKQEFGRLVVATTSQVTGKTLDENDQRRISDEAVATMQN